MRRFLIIWLSIGMALLTACATTSAPAPATTGTLPAEITVNRLKSMLDAGERFFLLDVRTPEEFVQDGRVAQATLIPLAELEQRLNELPTDQPIACICRSGNRSAVACELLTARGFQASNVIGGMRAWRAAGYPVVVGP